MKDQLLKAFKETWPVLLMFAVIGVLSLLPERKPQKAQIKKPQIEHANPPPAKPAKLHPKPTKIPFVISTGNRKTLIYIKSTGTLIEVYKNKSQKLRSKQLLFRLKKLGFSDSICYKLIQRRFICLFPNKKYKEVSISGINYDVIITATHPEKTEDPGCLKDFLINWIKKWENMNRDFESYISLYSKDFWSIHGGIEQWIKRKKQIARKVKYVEIIPSNQSFYVMPGSKLYVIIFDEIYRSNLIRVETTKAIMVRIKGKPVIVSEVTL